MEFPLMNPSAPVSQADKATTTRGHDPQDRRTHVERLNDVDPFLPQGRVPDPPTEEELEDDLSSLDDSDIEDDDED